MRNTNPRAYSSFPTMTKEGVSFIHIVLPNLIRDSDNCRIVHSIIHILSRSPIIETQTDIENHTAIGNIILSIHCAKGRKDFVNIIVQSKRAYPWFIDINILHFLERDIKSRFEFVLLCEIVRKVEL